MYPVLVGFVRCSSLSMPKVVEGNSESWCCGAEFWGSYYVPCLGVGFFWNLHASVGRLSEWWKSFVANLLMELADCFFFCFRVGALALAGVRWDVFCVNKVLCYDLVDPLSMLKSLFVYASWHLLYLIVELGRMTSVSGLGIPCRQSGVVEACVL